MAYGQQAGLPPAAGLYTVVGAAVAYALLTSTRTVAVGPSSTTAMITFAVVHTHAGGNTEWTVVLAAALSMLAGVVWLVAAALRLSVMAQFLEVAIVDPLDGLDEFGLSVQVGAHKDPDEARLSCRTMRSACHGSDIPAVPDEGQGAYDTWPRPVSTLSWPRAPTSRKPTAVERRSIPLTVLQQD